MTGDELTTAETSKLLHLTENRIRQLCRDKSIKSNKLGRKWLIPKDEVEYIKAHGFNKTNPETINQQENILDSPLSCNTQEIISRIFILKDITEETNDHIPIFAEIINDVFEHEIGRMPLKQGAFKLYTSLKWGGGYDCMWYISILSSEDDYQSILFDLRVLMERCTGELLSDIVFIIISDKDLSHEKAKIQTDFEKVKSFVNKEYQKNFTLELWDKKGLIEKQKQLGIII